METQPKQKISHHKPKPYKPNSWEYPCDCGSHGEYLCYEEDGQYNLLLGCVMCGALKWIDQQIQ